MIDLGCAINLVLVNLSTVGLQAVTQGAQCPPVAPATSNNWPAIISAMGILVAAVVALFKEDFQALRRRPRLTFDLLGTPPHSRLTYFEPGHVPVYYLRFWVENEGTARALDVELAITDVYEWKQTWTRVTTFPQMNLVWAHVLTGVLPGMSKGMGRHCDFARVIDPSAVAGKTELEVVLEALPSNRCHVLPAGRYLMCFRLGASNFTPVEKWYEVAFQGVWYPTESQMLQNGLTFSKGQSPI